MITGFYHVCCMNEWQTVLEEQVRDIVTSGLYERCDRIFIGKLGGATLPTLPPKFEVAYEGDPLDYEYPTLKLLHRHCRSHSGLVWYIHTKGVSHSRETYESRRDPWLEPLHLEYESLKRNLRFWRRFMMFYTVRKWRACLEAMHYKDLCGVAWIDRPPHPPHFSGNFWWARSQYVSTLPDIDTFRTRFGTPCWSAHLRGAAEYWVGQRKPRFHSFKQPDVNLYYQPASPTHYYPIHL